MQLRANGIMASRNSHIRTLIMIYKSVSYEFVIQFMKECALVRPLRGATLLGAGQLNEH